MLLIMLIIKFVIKSSFLHICRECHFEDTRILKHSRICLFVCEERLVKTKRTNTDMRYVKLPKLLECNLYPVRNRLATVKPKTTEPTKFCQKVTEDIQSFPPSPATKTTHENTRKYGCWHYSLFYQLYQLLLTDRLVGTSLSMIAIDCAI